MMNEQNSDINFLSIKEFSRLTGIPISTLRYYDKLSLFAPAKHGDISDDRRRYYSMTQIMSVKMIRVLSEMNVPLKTIRELTQSRSPEMVLKLLRKHKGMIAEQGCFLQEANSVIDTFIGLLREAMETIETEFSISEIPERRILLGGVNDWSGEGFYPAFARFCGMTHYPKMNLAYPVGGYFENMSAFLSAPSRPSRFFSLDPNGLESIAGGRYLSGYTQGYYGETNGVAAGMAAFAEKNELAFNGPVYNLYLTDEISVSDPKQYLLKVSVAVMEARNSFSRHPRLHF